MRTLEKKINERIIRELRERDMSQTELARRAEIPQGYLNELLNLKGKKRWNIEYVAKVADTLDIPAWQFFVDPADVIPSSYLKLMHDYQQLDPDGKRIVDGLLLAAAQAARGKKSGAENTRSKTGLS